MIYSISVKSLSIFSGSKCLMGPVSFRISPGKTLVIMGETGAGKSLIVQAIFGTLPSKLRAVGEIMVNNYRVDTLSKAEHNKLWGREITTLPQEPWRALDPLMRSFSQVKEAHRFVARQSQSEAHSSTIKAFDTLSLVGAERHFPKSLSGGMAQRVAFAAATAGNAPILFADEPTKGLDAEVHTKILDLLVDIPQRGGTLLVITHDVSVARRLGGEVLIMRDGDLVERGSVTTVLNAPSDAYTKSLLEAESKNWKKSPSQLLGNTLLKAENLMVVRGEKRLFGGFNLDLRAGEKVALIGPSGVGKTTVLDILAGLLKPESGVLSYCSSLSKHSIQKLYQDPPAAFPNRVPLINSLNDVAKRHKTRWSQVTKILEQLSVSLTILNRRPDEVSGGELQRISIARALTVKPKILLADEPTSRLDPVTQWETLAMLDNIATKEQIAIVLVTHDPHIAEKWADRTISLI